MSQVTVVGGGLAGLVAAIECAHRGVRVTVMEARDHSGGRARSTEAPYVADMGPHALYPPGPFWSWLKHNGLLPPLKSLRRRGVRFVEEGRLTLISSRFVRAVTRLRGPAPADIDFRTWAVEKTDPSAAEAATGLLLPFTYDHDPGRLSASFALERFRRFVSPRLKVRYVVGGWCRLVESLVTRARSLGVEIQTSTHVRELPPAPVIVATDPSNAALLLPDLRPPATGRVAVLDVGVRRFGRLPTAVFSLGEPCFAVRHSSVDPSICPPGHDLIELATAFPADETIDQAVKRMETLLDAAFDGWREHQTWDRRSSFDMGAGAVDLPGRTWRDRPAVSHGDGVFVAGDWAAAPGLLSEVAFATGRAAGERAASLIA